MLMLKKRLMMKDDGNSDAKDDCIMYRPTNNAKAASAYCVHAIQM